MTAPCTPFFNRSGGFGITGSPSAGWTFTKTAEASVGETLATWKVSDNATGLITFENGSATDALFIPRIRGVNSSTQQALLLTAQGTTDTGTTALMQFSSRISTGTAPTTRPLFSFAAHATEVASVSAKGVWTYTIAHTDATADDMAYWKLDEDTSSSASILNGSSTNAILIPMFRGINSGAQIACILQGRGTTDTGTNAVMRIDTRIGTGTSVATRPNISFTNAAVEYAQFTAAGNLALNYGISLGLRMDLKSYTVATLPAAGAAGGVIFVSDAGGNGPCIAVSNGTNWKRCDNVSTTVV